MQEALEAFTRESNRIEGITRDPKPTEVMALKAVLLLKEITVEALCKYVGVVQPGALLRSARGMNVRIGHHVPPSGGPEISTRLATLLFRVSHTNADPYLVHCEYEALHPFMDGNGRSGRALWLWTMRGNAPLGFLHSWYYQSLDASRHELSGEYQSEEGTTRI